MPKYGRRSKIVFEALCYLVGSSLLAILKRLDRKQCLRHRTVFEGILGIHNIVTVISNTCFTGRIDVDLEYAIIGERDAISNMKRP